MLFVYYCLKPFSDFGILKASAGTEEDFMFISKKCVSVCALKEHKYLKHSFLDIGQFVCHFNREYK